MAETPGLDGNSSETEEWQWSEAEDEEDRAAAELWSGVFVPPPPRPEFLDDAAAVADGLTTCDLCVWASRGYDSAPPEDAPAELGWVLTLVIVSALSAAIGAAVMITVIQCRNRLKVTDSEGEQPEAVTGDGSLRNVNKGPVSAPRSGGSSRVWTWLTLRSQASTAPCQIGPSNPGTPVQNHYTVDEAYAAVGEALYAELDRESAHSPAYQNTGYNGSDLEPDLAVSSAPSSAYYSDLSCPDRTYEAIGMAHVPSDGWEGGDAVQRRTQSTRLAAITETTSVPSDYV